jgi:acid stress-induced BolA-like protein IbaG/YrbA
MPTKQAIQCIKLMQVILGGSARLAYNGRTMSTPTPQEIHGDIAAGLDCVHVDVDGDGQHFQAVVVSTVFEGLSRIQRHQRVYAALGDKMQQRIHALSMKTLTPAEWQATQATQASLPAHAAPAPTKPHHH